MGFRSQERGRDYSFLVPDKMSERPEFTFSISTPALIEGRVRYQEAACICYQKLQRAPELETAEEPLLRPFTVSDREQDEYREVDSPAKR
jgi:hypothetical protein